MLERLVAGVVVIGLLLWGASILATPSDTEDAPVSDPSARILPGSDEPAPILPVGGDEDEEQDEEDEDGEDDDRRDRKKRGPG